MKYRSEIDGLRALAVIPVILYHAGFSAFGGGYIGVDVFFVLSGYLITTIIFDELKRGNFSLLRFYERRARRILPALFLVILTSIPFAWFWLMPRNMETYTQSILAVITFTSNFFFLSKTGYFETSSELQPLLHTWSLAVEEQYYIVFPMLMMLIWRRAPTIILSALLVASFLLAVWALSSEPAKVFFLLPYRAWELLVGALAALYLCQGKTLPVGLKASDAASALGIALIVFGIMAYDERTQFPGLNALPPVIGTLLVVVFARNGGAIHWILSRRPLVWIGLISYGAYLWHQPVFALFQHRFGSIAFSTYCVPLIALSFALAWAVYLLVEQPFRKRLSVRTLSWSILTSATVAISVGVVMYQQADDRPQNVPAYKWALANADANLLRYVERDNVFMDCAMTSDDVGVEQCDFGDPAAPRTLVLWGDSLALALLSGIDKVAREAGVGGVAFIANGCPPVPGLQNTRVPKCAGDTHDQILERVESLEGIQNIVITGNFVGAMSAGNVKIDGRAPSYVLMREKLLPALSRLKASKARVVFLEQGPTFPENVSDYLLENMRQGQFEPLSISRASFLSSLWEVRELSVLPDLYVDTVDFFCDDVVCPSVDEDDQLVFFDESHITREYSERLAQYLFQYPGF